MIIQISEHRFNALGGWFFAQRKSSVLAFRNYYSADEDRVLAALYFIRHDPDENFSITDNDFPKFGFFILARDKNMRYIPFRNQGIYWSARAAEESVLRELKLLIGQPTPELPEHPERRPGIDLFAENPGATLNPKYQHLRDSVHQSAARQIATEVANWFIDLDGNWVKDFQTTGYDARVWELYLFAVFTEMGFDIARTSAVPDFALRKGEAKVFVEAVTANPTGNPIVDISGAPPPPPDDYLHYIEHEMPQKFGSPILSKMRKKYWEMSHIKGHPFVLALADFHAPASMTWSHAALPGYLYGVGAEIQYDAEGKKFGVEKPLGPHVVGKKVVPTNFFGQPENRDLSAILFSNAGTIAKFNRMGVLAGFGNPDVAIVRTGIINDPSPGAWEGHPFKFNVEDPVYTEAWSDELEVYHNPNANVPLPEDVFSGATQYFLEDGELLWRNHRSDRRVLFSNSTVLVRPDDSEAGGGEPSATDEDSPAA